MTSDEIFTHCIVEHGDGNICFSCAKEAVAKEREECANLVRSFELNDPNEFDPRIKLRVFDLLERIAQAIREKGKG